MKEKTGFVGAIDGYGGGISQGTGDI